MNDTLLLVQCGDRGTKWIKYFMHYYKENWICSDFIDTAFLFENNIPEELKQDELAWPIYIYQTGAVPWGQGMINFLNSIHYKYILLLHEDYFLTDVQDALKLNRLHEIMEEYNMALLKICGDWAGNTATPKYPIEKLSKGENIYLYSLEGSYITSHQMSIWRRDYLLKTLIPEENPWQHELSGHIRARNLGEPVYAYLGEQPIPYHESVTAGAPRPTEQHWFNIEV